MPIYDYECPECGQVHEDYQPIGHVLASCLFCRGPAKRLISVPRASVFNQDADWIRSVTDVVNKKGGVHCQEFLSNPTRDNYQKWMNGEGLRHLEDGECYRPESIKTDRIKAGILSRRQERRRIEI